MNRTQLAQLIDHTNLKPDATDNDMSRLCNEARQYGFKTVVVNPVNVGFVARLLHGSDVGVCSVIGFPLGANTTKVKVLEAEEAIRDGASEIDMVTNIGALKSGRLNDVRCDIDSVATAVKGRGLVLKVIIEASLLTDEEKVRVCLLAKEVGVDYVKSSTGFAGGAKVDDIRLIRRTVGSSIGVKAAGGIRSYSDVVAMIEAGASRIGTSSGTKIMEECPA